MLDLSQLIDAVGGGQLHSGLVSPKEILLVLDWVRVNNVVEAYSGF